MTDHQFLLYIISRTISSVKPELCEAILNQIHNWHKPLSNLSQICRDLNLNPEQTKKLQTYNLQTEFKELNKALQLEQIHFTTLIDPDYPIQLSHIPDPPLILFYKGNLNLLQTHINISVVGSRKCSSYGKNVCEVLIGSAKSHKINIISGLAFGIDSECHKNALQNNLATTAVLGSGMSQTALYPKANYQLALKILENGGLILSEYNPHSEAFKHQFIARNRIIAALSPITIVVEAAKKSGALLTADFALDYNKQVFAVPGSIFSANSAGPLQLIQSGAEVITSGSTILDALQLPTQIPAQSQSYTPEQMIVLECIQQEPKSLEQLQTETQLPISELLSVITNLILNDNVFEPSPQIYSIKQ